MINYICLSIFQNQLKTKKPSSPLKSEEAKALNSDVKQNEESVQLSENARKCVTLENVQKVEFSTKSIQATVNSVSKKMQSLSLKGNFDNPVTTRALSSNKKCRQFLGIPIDLFEMIYKSCKDDLEQMRSLTKKDQLAIFFHKLKSGSRYTTISVVFDISERTCANVFANVIDVVFRFSKKGLWWFSKEEVKATMPDSFKVHFPEARCIIDASELKIQVPTKVRQAALSYSHYKSGHTAKFLVVVAPCGIIIFISRAFGGRITDSQLTNMSGFLKFVEPGMHKDISR